MHNLPGKHQKMTLCIVDKLIKNHIIFRIVRYASKFNFIKPRFSTMVRVTDDDKFAANTPYTYGVANINVRSEIYYYCQ